MAYIYSADDVSAVLTGAVVVLVWLVLKLIERRNR